MAKQRASHLDRRRRYPPAGLAPPLGYQRRATASTHLLAAGKLSRWIPTTNSASPEPQRSPGMAYSAGSSSTRGPALSSSSSLFCVPLDGLVRRRHLTCLPPPPARAHLLTWDGAPIQHAAACRLRAGLRRLAPSRRQPLLALCRLYVSTASCVGAKLNAGLPETTRPQAEDLVIFSSCILLLV
jgi:hypothetical protein